eukprot:EG_transcript_3846
MTVTLTETLRATPPRTPSPTFLASSTHSPTLSPTESGLDTPTGNSSASATAPSTPSLTAELTATADEQEIDLHCNRSLTNTLRIDTDTTYLGYTILLTGNCTVFINATLTVTGQLTFRGTGSVWLLSGALLEVFADQVLTLTAPFTATPNSSVVLHGTGKLIFQDTANFQSRAGVSTDPPSVIQAQSDVSFGACVSGRGLILLTAGVLHVFRPTENSTVAACPAEVDVDCVAGAVPTGGRTARALALAPDTCAASALSAYSPCGPVFGDVNL